MPETVRSLDEKEFAKLRSGLPDLAEWGRHILVPFEARKLASPTVVWLNERWFFERGIDVAAPDVRSRTETWLIEEFGFLVPQPNDPPTSYLPSKKVFYADRYGGSGLESHGGSGRAAINGMFQAKGIGATPLVGDVDQWAYSHGCVWLEEAIREAIYAEIAAAEFPHGAVPVVAIIDTGLNYLHLDGRLGERRALMIRPAAVRIAHLQRATMFRGTHETVDLSSSADAKRVRDAILHYESLRHESDGPYAVAPDIQDLFERFVDQIAYGRMQRLHLGGYFSSNIALTGELLDFGAMRAVADWSQAYASDHVPALGGEFYHIVAALESLLFFYKKYAQSNCNLDPKQLMSSLANRMAKRCDLECLRIWGIETVNDKALRAKVIEETQLYFHHQQRLQVSYQSALRPNQGWLYNAMLSDERKGEEGRVVQKVERAIRAYFGSSSAGEARRNASRRAAMRLLKPRDELDRELLQTWLYDVLGGEKNIYPPSQAMVSQAIDSRISMGRRHWLGLPPNCIVDEQWSKGGCALLACTEATTADRFVWVDAVRFEGKVRVLDEWIKESELKESERLVSGKRWRGRLPIREEAGGASRMHVGDRLVDVPPMLMAYP